MKRVDSLLSLRTWLVSLVVCSFVHVSVRDSVADEVQQVILPPFTAVRQTVEAHFASQRDRQPRDIISLSEVDQALRAVNKLGWEIEDQTEILSKTLPDSHVLVQTFRSPAGRKFMNQISGRPLMYDRFDRISKESGGPRLIQDIVKLPDGERYAKPKSGGGVPDLLDLLPKKASGTTRRIENYHKATGNLYTVEELIARLQISHQKAVEKITADANSSQKRP
jgi:hypothetical protein